MLLDGVLKIAFRMSFKGLSFTNNDKHVCIVFTFVQTNIVSSCEDRNPITLPVFSLGVSAVLLAQVSNANLSTNCSVELITY